MHKGRKTRQNEAAGMHAQMPCQKTSVETVYASETELTEIFKSSLFNLRLLHNEVMKTISSCQGGSWQILLRVYRYDTSQEG